MAPLPVAPKPANPSVGHYVPVNGQWQLIHAVGPGKWAPVAANTNASMAGPGVPSNSPLLNPNQTLSGQSLYNAAAALANAQDAGPLNTLAQQIATNDKQTAGAEKLTSGYFNQLGQQAQSGVNQEGTIGSNLNTTLAGIAGGTQSALQGIGQDQQASLLKYAPQSDASNSLLSPAMGALTQEIARQQGLSAQNEGAYRAAGAQQGANYQGLAASNLGTDALKGEEAIGKIGQAGQLKDVAVNTSIGNLQAAKGALLATDLGKLRQQEITNQISQQGLGIKAATVAQSNTNNLRTTGTSAANNQRTTATSAANNARTTSQSNLNNLRTTGTSAANNALNNAVKTAIANAKTGVGARKPLPPAQNNTILKNLGEMTTLISAAQKAGHSEASIRQALQTGGLQKGFAAQDPNFVQAAYELLGYGSIDQATASWMHNAGIRGGTYNRKPIKVTANYKNPGLAPGNLLNQLTGFGT